MVDNFVLKMGDEKMAGYIWERENPENVVCLVHGIGEHAGRYDRIASRMQENGMAVISMDLRGHGLSPGKRGHCAPRERILADVDVLLQEARIRYPHVPLVLYGHSMGGNIALDYRRRGGMKDEPDAYISSAPWIILERKISKPLMTAVTLLSRIKPDFQIAKNRELVHDYITVRTALDGMEVAEELLNTQDHGKKLLLMHGNADKICCVEGSRMYSKIAYDCVYVEWEGYYHEIHNGSKDLNGDLVIEYVIQWIREKV